MHSESASTLETPTKPWHWTDLQDQATAARDAVALIKNGHRVFVHGALGHAHAPSPSALAEREDFEGRDALPFGTPRDPLLLRSRAAPGTFVLFHCSPERRAAPADRGRTGLILYRTFFFPIFPLSLHPARFHSMWPSPAALCRRMPTDTARSARPSMQPRRHRKRPG